MPSPYHRAQALRRIFQNHEPVFDCNLLWSFSAQNSPLTGENASARIAQLNILDALYTTLALKYNKTSYSILQKTKDSVRSNKV